jgi:multidrug efflux pump subunit AcrB
VRPHPQGRAGQHHGWFYRFSENTFNGVQAFYNRTLRWSIDHSRTILCVFAGSLVASVALLTVMQQDFLPSDDTGRLQGNLQAANGTSYRQMALYVEQAAKIVGDDPDIEGVMAQMEGANGSAGTNNARLMMIKLRPLGQRKSTPDQIITRLRP